MLLGKLLAFSMKRRFLPAQLQLSETLSDDFAPWTFVSTCVVSCPSSAWVASQGHGGHFRKRPFASEIDAGRSMPALPSK